MTITEYIQNNIKLNKLDYGVVFITILELIADGHLNWEGRANV